MSFYFVSLCRSAAQLTCVCRVPSLPQEDIAKLLRFESSALPAGQQTSLMEYASRMKAGTRNIHYLCAPNRHLAEHSPYYEAMKQKDMEVRRPNSLVGSVMTCGEKS